VEEKYEMWVLKKQVEIATNTLKRMSEEVDKMLENQMVMHNGYGIRDSQEFEPIPIKDICGSEVFPDEDILVSPDGEVLLKENAVQYLISSLGFEERTAGE